MSANRAALTVPQESQASPRRRRRIHSLASSPSSKIQTQAWSQTGFREISIRSAARLASEQIRQFLGRPQDPAAGGFGKLRELLRVRSRIEEFGRIVEQLQVDAGLGNVPLTVQRDDLESERLQCRAGVLQDGSRGGSREFAAIGVVSKIGRELHTRDQVSRRVFLDGVGEVSRPRLAGRIGPSDPGDHPVGVGRPGLLVECLDGDDDGLAGPIDDLVDLCSEPAIAAGGVLGEPAYDVRQNLRK